MYPGIDHFNFYSISNLQFLYHMETTHFKKGLPSALQPWLVVGTREGSSDSSWADSLRLASSIPPTSQCCKKIDEGTSKYRHKIYLPGGYTTPSPKLPQGQQMPALIWGSKYNQCAVCSLDLQNQTRSGKCYVFCILLYTSSSHVTWFLGQWRWWSNNRT